MSLAAARVVLVSDTHLGAGAAQRLIAKLDGELADADAVLHAGDITHGGVLDALAARAPRAEIHAVAGNCDGGLHLPERLTLRIADCAVAMLHDSGTARGRTARLRRLFPDADLVVFGHSHVPWHVVDVRSADAHVQHQVNPGSAMQRRRAPACTIARVLLTDGAVASVRHIPLP